MTDVQRFTTDYIAVEDRIRLSVEHKDGSVQILWLTRPLLKKLVVRLIKAIDASPPSGTKVGKTLEGAVRKRFAQEAAEAALKPQKPVRVGTSLKSENVSVLVTRISLRAAKGKLNIGFQGGNHVLKSIPLDAEAIRQWLGLLHKCYCHADWGDNFWPAWITSPRSVVNSTRLN